MPGNGGSWRETMTLILSIGVMTAAAATYIAGSHHTISLEILNLRKEQTVILRRISENGWSRSQQSDWVHRLRAESPHPVPGLDDE